MRWGGGYQIADWLLKRDVPLQEITIEVSFKSLEHRKLKIGLYTQSKGGIANMTYVAALFMCGLMSAQMSFAKKTLATVTNVTRRYFLGHACA